ncbi:hypothetical protein BJV78DRAFT_1235655 [Lactifluus subvellereus]|nr:hypothetical protein BJV78DRAFT_1235655 [Lactifluus subvellereus]
MDGRRVEHVILVVRRVLFLLLADTPDRASCLFALQAVLLLWPSGCFALPSGVADPLIIINHHHITHETTFPFVSNNDPSFDPLATS